MIQHAIIGCGRIAENHADAFARLDGVQIKYAIDLDEEKAKALAEKFSIPNTGTSYEEILKDKDLHSISLAVPHDLHGPMALQAVAAGKHVLIEKPLVIDPAQGRQLLEAATTAGLTVLPVAQHRYDPIVREIKNLLDSGEMGGLRYLRGHLECLRPPGYYSDSDWRGSKAREGGSVLINQAYHLLDLLLYFGGPVSRVAAAMSTFQEDIMETEDTIGITLQFRNRAVGSLSVCGAGGSAWSSYIEIICEKGLVAFDINFPNGLHRFEMSSKRGMKEWRERLRAALPDPQSLPPGLAYYGISHRDQAADFISRINKGEALGATLEEALYVVEVIDDIYTAAGSRQKQ